MNKLKHILFISLFISSLIAHSQQKDVDYNAQLVTNFIQNQNTELTINNSRILSLSKLESLVIIYDLEPQGFVILDLNSREILGFSFENNFIAEESDDFMIAKDLIEHLSYTQNNNAFVAPDKSINEMWGPTVYNMWGQVNCTNNTGQGINVTNIYTPNHYAVGCVAVSQATILKHYNWPPKGMGTHSYTDNSGSSTGYYAVSHKDYEYHLPLALDRYRGKESTQEERDVAGLISFHSAVSLEMDFEYNGSTSNVNRIPGALASNFRFTALYKSRSTSTFWSILDSNMVWEKPVVLAVENSSGGGHSVVCDGLKIEDGDYYYHLNMGWWGTSNGWYKIRGSFNAGGYNYVIGAAMNILPEPYVEIPILWDDATHLDLCWSYPENANAEAFEIQRSVNGGSWETFVEEVTDTCWTIFPQEDTEYAFRIRAKTNGRWYANSYSEAVQLVRSFTGIEEESFTKLSTHPNPFTNQLHIQLDATESYQIEVFNSTGQIVFSEFRRDDLLLIDSSKWPSGIYFIKYQSDTTEETIKCVKR